MKTARHMVPLVAALILTVGAAQETYAQTWRQKSAGKEEVKQDEKAVREGGMRQTAKGKATYRMAEDGKVRKNQPGTELGEVMEYIIEDGDTIFVDEIKASKVYSRLPKQKGKEWRKYYRLVHNFSKAYPYALVAKKLVMEADSTIAADNLKRVRREKYINEVQKELFDVFEGQMRKLTVSQGALLMKLIDREVGKSSYGIIKDYKSGMTAGFWQGIAKIFGTDLKKPYDPEGEDKVTEELVKIWQDGDFDAFYFSIFWKDPPKLDIPERYL